MAPSEVRSSPGSTATPLAQPSTQAARRRAGWPRAGHTVTTPPSHVTASSEQIVTVVSSVERRGRTLGDAGSAPHSCATATASSATTSMPSLAHPRAQRLAAAGRHGHTHGPPALGRVFSPGEHGCGRCAAIETSTWPSTHRARPSLQSVPPRSKPLAPDADDPRGVAPPRVGSGAMPIDDPHDRKPRSHPPATATSATSRTAWERDDERPARRRWRRRGISYLMDRFGPIRPVTPPGA